MFSKEKLPQDSNQTIKLIVTIGFTIAVILASAGIFYYYVIFTPNLEQQKLDLQKQKNEQERADLLAAKKEEENRLAQEQQNMEQKEQDKSIAYSQCISNAEANYTNNWARNCQGIAERNKVNLQKCLNTEYIMNNEYMGEKYCKENYGNTTVNSDCTLPRVQANDLNNSLRERKEQCLVEAQNSLL